MKKVTFKSSCSVKQGRKWIQQSFQFEEIIKTEADARLRALALNWQIVKIEDL